MLRIIPAYLSAYGPKESPKRVTANELLPLLDYSRAARLELATDAFGMRYSTC